jgi:GMP synthase (glutamine-hydrolysing)
VKPFLLLATRAEDEAADNEYDAFLAAGQLDPAQLRRVRLEAAPLPALDLDDYSGIVVGGSPFTASDPVAQKSESQRRVERELGALLDDVVERDLPFLGACYGIGLLGTHQHGVVDRRWSEPIGRIRVSLTGEGAADPVFSALPESFDAFVGHKEACSELPPGAVLLATGEHCRVQAFRLRRNIYATQFHPELTVDGIVTRIHVYRNYGYFQPDQMHALIESVEGVSVPEPGKVLAAFVRRYARP